MAAVNEAIRCLTARVGAGSDAMVRGDPATSRQVMDAAAFDQFGHVIPVTAESGELNLSNLMAQLSGETDLGGQDDAVLELGFRRLTGPGRTILILQAPHGIGRSALRYLQHMTRLAPRLSLVVSASTALDALLEEPGFAALRTRLQALPAIDAIDVPEVVEPSPLAAARRHGAAIGWIASAVVAVVVAGGAWISPGGAWIAHGVPRAVSPAFAGVPVHPALVPAPLLAVAAEPSRVSVPSPMLAAIAQPFPAVPSPIVHAEQARTGEAAALVPVLVRAEPPPLAPALAPALPLPRVAKAAVVIHPRRTEMARLPPRYPAWRRYEDRDRYADEPPYPEPAPGWIRRGMPYPEAFVVDLFGMRLFRYDR